MFVYDSERKKNNEAIRKFIVKLAMVTMVKLRNNDGLSDSILPIPKTLDQITKTNEMMEDVVENIVRNELKLYDITDDKELYFKAGSPFAEMDVPSMLEHARDNTDVSEILGEKLIYTAKRVKNVVLKVIKELISNVKAAKIAYEGSRKASNIVIQPISNPDIIEYDVLKGAISDTAGIAIIPSASENQSFNTLEMIKDEELTELSLTTALIEFNAFNESFIRDFLSTFSDGEIIKIAKTYLRDITNNNQNLSQLTIKDFSKTNELYLVYLLVKMLSEKYYPENDVLAALLKSLGILTYTRFKDIETDTKNGILVEWVDEKKIYINTDVFNKIDVDVTAIVGAVISSGKERGGLAITADEVTINSAMHIEAYNKYEAANMLNVQMGMKSTLVNIFTNEIKKVYEANKPEDAPEMSDIEISAKCFGYLNEKDFKDIVDIEKAAQDVVLNLIYTDEASKLFIEYFTAYSSMEASLTSQDCALLAGTTLVALEIGAYLDIK